MGPWKSVSLNVQAGHAVNSQFYKIVAPNGREYEAPKGRCWIYNEARMNEEIQKMRSGLAKVGIVCQEQKRFLCEKNRGLNPETV